MMVCHKLILNGQFLNYDIGDGIMAMFNSVDSFKLPSKELLMLDILVENDVHLN